MMILRRLFTLMILPALVFVSCSSAPSEKDMLELTGTLKRVSLQSEANLSEYRFLPDDGSDVQYLSSDSVILDKYLDDHIAIQGYMTSGGVLNVITASEVDDKALSAQKKASYSNNEFGLYFSYPTTWRVSEVDDTKLELEDKETNEVIASMFKVADNDETIETYLTRNFPSETSSEVQLGLVRAYRITNTETASQIDVAQVNGEFFTFTLFDDSFLLDYNSLTSSLRFFSSDELEDETLEGHDEEDDENQGNSSDDKVTGEPDEAASDLISYILAHTDLLPVDEEVSGVQEVELANGSYVYVTYTDGEKKKKVLFEYEKDAKNYSFSEKGLFESGETTDWVKVSGSNIAGNKSREVYAIEDDSVQRTASLGAGKSLYENSYLDFSAQYPRNWYYEAKNISSNGGVQKITFSNKPLEEEPDQTVEIAVYKKGQVETSGLPTVQIGNKTATLIEVDGMTKYAIEAEDGNIYVTQSSDDEFSREALVDIVETLATE